MNDEKKIMSEILEVVNGRKEFLLKNYPEVREIYNKPYNLPELDTLRHEICLSISFGLYQSAITLTNHLMEAFLKLALTYNDVKPAKDAHKTNPQDLLTDLASILGASGDKFNDKNLGDNINKACKLGLISKDEKKQLNEFREDFRNAYSHADRKKQHKDITIPVQAATIEDNKMKLNPEEEVNLYSLPIFQGIAQWHHAEVFSIPYFTYLDGVIRSTLSKIFPNIEKGFDFDE